MNRNILGPVSGPILIYALAGEPHGEKILRVREKLYFSQRRDETSHEMLSKQNKELMSIMTDQGNLLAQFPNYYFCCVTLILS